MEISFYIREDNYGYLHDNIPFMVDLFTSCNDMLDFIMTYDIDKLGPFVADLEEATATLAKQIISLLPLVKYPNKLKEISMNMPLLTKRLNELYQNGTYEEFDMKLQCEFRPLFLTWAKTFNFFMVQCINDERIKEYNAHEMEQIARMAKELKKDVAKDYKYDLSIVVLFYGKQQMTKDCLEAIHNYTKGYTYELITFDNGSDEETTKWCNSLPHSKKVHYPVNIGSAAAGNSAIYFASEFIEGRFLVFIANDIIVTENWAKSLYECMASDERIIWAAPVTNSLSNLQTIPVSYEKNNMEQMQEFAKQYNQFDPHKWQERARLFLAMGITRQEEIAKFYDFCSPYFCYDMFADDDVSLRYRRAGYKQMLCKDVFIHHYGSATLGESQFQVMDLGREQFYNKYGVDAWVSIQNFAPVFLQLWEKQNIHLTNTLIIEPKFGEITLSVQYFFKAKGCQSVKIDAITSNKLYLPDLEPLHQTSYLIDEAPNIPATEKYDLIFYNGFLEDDNYMHQYVKIAKKHLNAKGIFVFYIKNFYSYNNLQAMLMAQNFIDDNLIDKKLYPKSSFTNVEEMKSFTTKNGINVKFIAAINDGTSKEDLKEVFADININPAYYESANILYYVFCCGI